MATAMSLPTHCKVSLPGGLQIACQCWGRNDAKLKILALHGWMDNSATWTPIAPRLAELDAYIVAADLPGHGHSGHRDAESFYYGIDYAANSLELLGELHWETAVLMGHSLGAGLSCIIAAAAPELVSAVLLVDGLGPYPQPIEQAVSVFRRAVDAKGGYLRAPRSIYPSIDAAAAHRVAAVGRNPGKQWISLQGARWLVERALEPASAAEVAAAAAAKAEPAAAAAAAAAAASSSIEVAPAAAALEASATGEALPPATPAPPSGQPQSGDAGPACGGAGSGSNIGTVSEGPARTDTDSSPAAVAVAAAASGWCFRHDPKIKGPAPHHLSEEQARAFLSAIRAPVLHVAAADGWPRPPGVTEARALLVHDLEAVTLPGSHHLHLDPDTAPAVLEAMVGFLRRRVPHLLPPPPAP